MSTADLGLPEAELKRVMAEADVNGKNRTRRADHTLLLPSLF